MPKTLVYMPVLVEKLGAGIVAGNEKAIPAIGVYFRGGPF
jgi:hypothetical protein